MDYRSAFHSTDLKVLNFNSEHGRKPDLADHQRPSTTVLKQTKRLIRLVHGIPYLATVSRSF